MWEDFWLWEFVWFFHHYIIWPFYRFIWINYCLIVNPDFFIHLLSNKVNLREWKTHRIAYSHPGVERNIVIALMNNFNVVTHSSILKKTCVPFTCTNAPNIVLNFFCKQDCKDYYWIGIAEWNKIGHFRWWWWKMHINEITVVKCAI